MKAWTMAAILACTTPAAAQEDLDLDLERLAEKIAPEGAGAKLAGLLKSDAGRLVIKEKITTRVTRAVERLDRDPQSHYESYLLSEDADGILRLRPEHQREFNALAREVERRTRAWKDFDKAGAELGAKIPETGDLEKKLKSYWLNPEYRMALYQRLGPESREPDAEDLWNQLIGRSLFRGNDGKLRLRGNYRDESLKVMSEIRGESDGLAGLDEQVSTVLARLHKDERKTCSTPEGKVVLARRLAQAASEGAEDPVAKLTEAELESSDGSTFRFKEASRAALDEIGVLVSLGNELRPVLEQTAKELADDTEYDRKLKKLLQEERAAVLWVSKMKATQDERRATRDAAIQQFRDDHFEVDENGAVTLKKGRFVDDQGKDSAESIANECDGNLNEYATTRATFEGIAERTIEPAVSALFQTRAGASALTEHQTRVLEELKQVERDGGVQKFIRGYLQRSGDRYVVRAERAARVEEMTRRAQEVQEALDRAAREEVKK